MFTKLYLGMAYLNPMLGALEVPAEMKTKIAIGFGVAFLIIGGVIGLSSWSKFADASHKLEQGHQSHTGIIGAILAVVGIVIIVSIMNAVMGGSDANIMGELID